MQPARHHSHRPRNTFRLLIVAGGFLLAANLLVLAGLSVDSDPTTGLPPTITRLVPERGAVIRPQEDIGVDLRDDFTGVLRIDGGTELPEDQYQRVPELGIVLFRPVANREVVELEPGAHQVSVLYWKRTDERENPDTRLFRYSWNFTVG